MACCTNCTLVRTKHKSGAAAHYDAGGNSFNFTTPPTNPISPPTSPKNGDTLIEYYDNALAFWTYSGGNWVLDFYASTLDKGNTHADLSSTILNFSALPAAPVTAPSSPVTGDTLHENYANAQVFWTYNGITWTRDYVIASGGNKSTHSNQSGATLDETTLPAAPLSPPASPTANDTLIEHYGNADIFWTYNGATWTRNFYSTKCCTILNDETGNSFDPNAITTPLNPPTGTTGNTLIERYDNAVVYWEYDGTNWTYQFHTLDAVSNRHNHHNETGASIDINALPATPVTAPTTPLANDTLVEHFDNGNVYWTYNGTNWVRDFVDLECCTVLNDETTSTLNPAAIPTSPLNPPAIATPGTPLIERYDNGTVFWQYDGTNWVYQFHSFDGTSNKHTHSDQVSDDIIYTALPATPQSPPVSPIANDTLVEHFSNGDIYWTYNGTVWVQDWVDSDCCTLLRDEGVTTIDPLNLPTAPLNPPAASAPGNVLVERYNNGTVFWEFDGTNWTYQFHTLDSSGGNLHTHSNQIATFINYTALPTTPIVSPTAPLTGDTLVEHYGNGDIYWTYDGANWVQDWVDSDCCTSVTDETGTSFDPLALPGTPANPPANPSPGNILIEHFDNGEIYWEFDGTTWNPVFTKPDQLEIYSTHYDASGNLITVGAPPAAPQSPPTGVNAGHTLHELYDNGQIFWTYDGTNWVLDYVIINKNSTYEYTATGNYDCANPPTVPQTSPATVIEGDRIVEHYNNSTRQSAVVITWEYDGVTWNIVARENHNMHFQVEDKTEEIVPLNVANGTGYLTPLTPGATTDYINGDTLYEQYGNGRILWTYETCAWVRKTIVLDCCCFEAYVTPIITVTAQDICVGTNVTFTDDSIHHSDLDTVCEYQSTAWDFGDGTTGTGQVINHSFSDPGLYFVEMTSTCTSGASATQTIAVKVSEIETDIVVPTTGIVAEPVTIQSGANVSGCDPTYLWTFGDGSSSSLRNPGAHTYAAAGTYTVALTVSCANGCTDSISYTITVSEADAVIAVFSVSDSSICLITGDTATFVNSSSSTICTIDTWLWEVSVNGGAFTTLSTALTPPVYAPTATGTHVVRLTATCSATGETGTTTRTLVVEDPNPAIGLSSATITTNQPVTVTDTTTGCTVASRLFEVSVNGGAFSNISTEQLFTYTPTVDGTHDFRLTVTCANGCSTVATRTLTASSTAFVAAEFTIVDNTLSLNLGNSTALNDATTSSCVVDDWLWEASDNGGAFVTIGTTQNIPAFTPATSGTHTIRLTSTCTGAGISDSVTHNIVVTALVAAMTVSSTAVSAGDVVTLTDTSTSVNCTPSTRQWEVSFNGGAYTAVGTASPQTHTATTAGTYDYRLTVTCADGVTIDTVTETVTATAACAGTETCYTVCAPSATFADWTDSTAWDASNEDFANSVVRNQVIRDGLRVSALTDIAGTGINGTITGDGAIKTTNAGVNESGGSLVLRITDNGTNDRRAIVMTFAQPVDVTFQLDAMRLGQTAQITGDGNFHYIPYSDGTPQITSVVGDNSANLTVSTPNGDSTNRSGFVCGTALTQFRLEFSSTGNVGSVVNLYFTMSVKAAGSGATYKVCDVGGTLTIVNLNDPNDTPTAIGLDWEELAACP